ncbi:flagellar filament capping protein FliD [Paenibacillus hodogayensis]|uniref:Flagellar hook-associated protein 2 n=1 Tax=Paenibacillus hodogayensis TaxID=279208 RepID=A0ABV5W7X1_9BACL
MRIAGLSGFDVDGTVAKLMQAQRIPLDTLTKKKQSTEWRRDAYRDINLKMTDFRNNKLFNFKAEGTFNKKTISVSGNAEAVTAKATASATTGTISVQVKEIAVAASNFSEGEVTKDGFDRTKTLLSQSEKLTNGSVIPAAYTFEINGKEIKVDPAKESLNDVIAKINRESNVTAYFDATSKRLSFTAKETGLTNGSDKDGKYITFKDKTGNFFESLAQVHTDGDNKKDGKNASVVINGLETTRTSNTITVNGIEVTLNKAGGSAAIITPQTNPDEIMESVKKFVADYNETLEMLQKKVTEVKDRDYEPLTDEQKESLSEKQIEKWEEKAKNGQLRNDPILTSLISSMRSIATGLVNTGNPKIRSLADIGIKTGQFFENGKLYVESEEKLREAIESDPEAVKALFTQDAVPGGSGTEVGLGERLYDKLKLGTDELTKKAGLPSISNDDSRLAKEIYDISALISKQQKRLEALEKSYYTKFSSMEAALNRYNSQSQYLANQFGGSSK